MNCCECGAKITEEEDAMQLPGKLVICETCWNRDLDKPVRAEDARCGTQTSETVDKGWLT